MPTPALGPLVSIGNHDLFCPGSASDALVNLRALPQY
jgi:hypothetical protein